MINKPSHTVRFRTWFIVGASTAGLALALSAHRSGVPVIAATASQQAAGATVNDFKIPPGYRDWKLNFRGYPWNAIRTIFVQNWATISRSTRSGNRRFRSRMGQ